ncbi:MAG TPA: glycerol-3-phosphate dehydrogenase [Bacteroidales bacterium]|nr:glycerol-3-phosphate dehydrogenase [Bacteroidales bacterium]
MKPFSALNRNKNLEYLAQQTELDLIIIGGGITGAGIALDASLRGLKVALFEAADFASGTSSRSTKLIHGGLRYLAQFEIGLVASTGKERAVLYKNAPHLVYPQKMLLPIIEGGSMKKLPVKAALMVYDFLAGVNKPERNKMHSLAEVKLMEPLLNNKKIQCALSYYEYKSSDSRLVIEALKKASQFGTIAVNYAKVTEFVKENAKITGVKVTDTLSNQTYQINAKYTVNAAGVWTDEVRKTDNPISGKKLYITKGIHLVVSKETLPINHAIYFDTDDKRMMFAIPKTDVVYIGTTDTPYTGNLSEPEINSFDIDYVIRNTERMFTGVKITPDKVIGKWAGLRPLIFEEGKSPSEMSRHDEIFISDSGLISITGGKLTGYRLMAKKIIDLIGKNMLATTKRNIGKCKTLKQKLSGGNFNKKGNYTDMVEFADAAYDEAKHVTIKPAEFKRLVYRYGSNISKITEHAYELFNETGNSEMSWLLSELHYTLNHEMVLTADDFLIRRTEISLFEPEKAVKIKETVEKTIAEYFASK